MNNNIRVGIIDDHTLFRQGLIELIKRDSEIHIVFDSGNGKSVLETLKENPVDVLLLDINMPEISGLKLLPLLKKHFVNIKILMLSQHSDRQTISYVMRKGANGFLPKTAHFSEIIAAIKTVHDEGLYLTKEVSKTIALQFNDDIAKQTESAANLTSREKEVLTLICEEKTIKEIGEELFISSRTVESHLENLYKKTGAKKREGLALFAVRNNIFNAI